MRKVKHVIAVDFGSTYTKVVAIDSERKKIILSDKVPSTVHEDACIGLKKCFAKVRTVLSEEEIQHALKLASSSAAGGLRMLVVGITKTLSGVAATETVFGAGAKVVGNYWEPLTSDTITEIENSKAEIIFFCGGYEHGNRDIVIHNAEMLARSNIQIPIIYSGNSELVFDIRNILKRRRKECFIIDNIIPDIGILNMEPAREVIRNLFMDRITDLKGLHNIKRYFSNDLVPTPAAVLSAGELLSRGTELQEGFGEMMLVDVGGATTDIYSFNDNLPYKDARLIGVEETYDKRTVEGDLGMRESSESLLAAVSMETLVKETGLKEQQIKDGISRRCETTDMLPDTKEEYRLENAIVHSAVRLAARRHAGRVEYTFEKNQQKYQKGKNLTKIHKVIGTGGAILHNISPGNVLKELEKSDADKRDMLLMPVTIEPYVDSSYVLFAAGLLREYDEETALAIMKQSICKLEDGQGVRV